MSLVEVSISAVIGYFLGCFQTAYIVGKLAGKIDIRSHGSNNAGASNVTMVLGWKYGALTALLDILKASLSVVFINNIFPGKIELLFIAGTFSILGHIFPFYLKFKGGKGAASFIGMALAIDFKIALICILIIVIVTLIIDYIAVGSIAMFIALPVTTYLYNYSLTCTAIGIGLAMLCIYKHQINIKRILNNEETGLRKVATKKK